MNWLKLRLIISPKQNFAGVIYKEVTAVLHGKLAVDIFVMRWLSLVGFSVFGVKVVATILDLRNTGCCIFSNFIWLAVGAEVDWQVKGTDVDWG